MNIQPCKVLNDGKGNAAFALSYVRSHHTQSGNALSFTNRSMKELKIFENAQFGQIRTSVSEKGEPLFCLADVCKILGLTNPSQVKTTLNQGGVITNEVGVQTGTKQDGTPAIQLVSMNFISEPNLYKCIFQSRKEEAEAFQDWVCGDVLPSIRQTGGYLATSDTDTNEEILAKAVLVAQKTIEKKDQRIHQLEQASEQQTLTIKEQAKTIDTLEQKVSYLDQILQSKSTVATSQIAQDYGMSAKKFNLLLHNLKIQRKVSGQWILCYPHIDKGYVHSETINIQVSVNGAEITKTVMHTKWTQAGRLFLYEKLKKNNVLPLIEQ